MALSGNIESFPLSEVLRLAARSGQSGLLRVEAGGTAGRVYFSDGFLVYATTRDRDDLGGDLGQLGMIDPHLWYPVERGEEPITSALMDGKTEDDFTRFLAERVADVLVRLLRSRHGHFDFEENADPQYITGQRFNIDDVLRGVETRVREWAKIEAVIPVADSTIHLVRDLGRRGEVTIPADTWRIIAALGLASTVEQVADATGLSDFVVARTMAGLVNEGLLEVRQELDDLETFDDVVRFEPASADWDEDEEEETELEDEPESDLDEASEPEFDSQADDESDTDSDSGSDSDSGPSTLEQVFGSTDRPIRNRRRAGSSSSSVVRTTAHAATAGRAHERRRPPRHGSP